MFHTNTAYKIPLKNRILAVPSVTAPSHLDGRLEHFKWHGEKMAEQAVLRCVVHRKVATAQNATA